VRESAARQAGSTDFVHVIMLCFGTKEEPRGELKEVCDVMFERFMMLG